MLQDIAALEKEKIADTVKPVRRARLQRNHAAVRWQRRRIEFSALYDSYGQLIQGLDAVGEALGSYWRPIFAHRLIDERLAERFMPYIQPLPIPSDWSWPIVRTRAIAEAASESTPDLDGLGYSLWAPAPQVYHDTLDAIGTHTQTGGPIPPQLHATRTVCIPKAEVMAEQHSARPSAGTLHLDGWCTAARFRQKLEDCRFGGCGDYTGDDKRHCVRRMPRFSAGCRAPNAFGQSRSRCHHVPCA